jgi:putative thioredoxin
VKINIDENPAYAQQLRVQSIPTVYAFDKGRPVDGFMGAVPESQLKAFIERLGGADAGAPDIEGALAAAREAMDLGDFGGAAQVYAEILQEDPAHVKAVAGLARCYLAGGDASRAQEILKMAPADKAGDPDIVSVRTALELADEGRDAGDPATLELRLRQDPNDHAARFALARARIGRGDLAAAASELLEIVSRNREWHDHAARKLLLKIFDAAGPAADLTKEGRRKLSAILFS